MKRSRERVLVTGAGGFVGRNLCQDFAAAGLEVHGVHRPSTTLWRLAEPPEGIRLHEADLTEGAAFIGLLERVRPAWVVHAAAHAARSSSSTDAVVTDTVLSTGRLVEALRGSPGTRALLLGSSLEYAALDRPLREDDPLGPTTWRGACKAAATTLALGAAAAFGLDIAVLRTFHVYGPWDHPDRLIPRAIRAAFFDEPLALTEPALTRDYVYVADLSAACLAAAAAPRIRGRVWNIAGGRAVSNEQVAAQIGEILGRQIDLRPGAHEARTYDRRLWCADIELARRELGWHPQTDLHVGLRETAAWYRDFWNRA